MEISQDTKEVIKFLQNITGNNLRKPKDLELFLEIGASYSQDVLINEFIFTGASVWNLSLTLKKAKQGEEGLRKLNSEFEKNIEEFKNQIKKFTGFCDSSTNKRLSDIYIPGTGGALLNIIDLSHDLAELKYVQITLKSNKKY